MEALARDDVERKKFLTMAGRKIGAGAAATGLAAFIAACGSSSSSSSSQSQAAAAASSTPAAGTSTSSSSGARPERSRDRQLRADARVPGVAVLRQGRQERLVPRQDAVGLEVLRCRGGPACDRAPQGRQRPWDAGDQADGQVPDQQRRSGRSAGRRGREHSAQRPTWGRPGISRARRSWRRRWRSTRSRRVMRRRLNTLLKKSPTPDGAFAQADVDGAGARGRQAVHRLTLARPKTFEKGTSK